MATVSDKAKSVSDQVAEKSADAIAATSDSVRALSERPGSFDGISRVPLRFAAPSRSCRSLQAE